MFTPVIFVAVYSSSGAVRALVQWEQCHLNAGGLSLQNGTSNVLTPCPNPRKPQCVHQEQSQSKMQGLIGVTRLMLKQEQQPAVPKHNKYLSGICTFAWAAKKIKTTGNVHFKVRNISTSVSFCSSLYCYENRAHSSIHRPIASLEHLGIR